MKMAVENFESEYGIERNVLGRHSKLYCQKSWNTSAWMEVKDTETLVRLVMDQMLQTKRINQGKELMVRFAFGRAKSGFEFEDVDEYEEYMDLETGAAISFSQNDDGQSPYENKMGAVLREGTWRNPARVAELVQFMYTDQTCKLFHGFTKEHSNSFYRFISINLSTKKYTLPFLPFIKD